MTFNKDNEEILIFGIAGKAEDFIHYYRLKEDNYLGTYGFNINRNIKQPLNEFISLIFKRFIDYDLFLGFPYKNRDAIGFLKIMILNALKTAITILLFLMNTIIKLFVAMPFKLIRTTMISLG